MESNVLAVASTALIMSGDLELVGLRRGLPDSTGFDPAASVERRKRVRTKLHWPLVLERNQHEPVTIESTTRDLSSGGFYCLIRVQLAEGERLRCSLKIPTHDPRGGRLERTLECQVRVVRIVPQESSGIFGVACHIEEYRLSS
jgi:hypothetical protein